MSDLQREYPGWPVYEKDEVSAVETVLRSGKVNYWTGNEVRKFESDYATYVGMPYAIAIANGTLALELALRCLRMGPEDEVIVTCRSFVASASCVTLCGATPVFANIDADSQNITAKSIEDVITPRTRAIILVHLAGWPCEMEEILELANSRGLKLIEDCAQAHGATYKDAQAGSFGDAAAFSFCQDKIISTGGEGGMLLLKDESAFKLAWSYKDHGKSYDLLQEERDTNEFLWLHESFGSNWRMTEMQAVIGRIQLGKLESWVTARQQNAKLFNDAFSKHELFRVTIPPEYSRHAYYKYYVFLRPERLKEGWDRRRLLQQVSEKGVPIATGSCGEIYREGAFVNAGFGPEQRFEGARDLAETSLVFPVHPTLSTDDINHMISVTMEVADVACKK